MCSVIGVEVYLQEGHCLRRPAVVRAGMEGKVYRTMVFGDDVQLLNGVESGMQCSVTLSVQPSRRDDTCEVLPSLVLAPQMCSNALRYALGPALALALCSCGAPGLAYAQELDNAPVLERLDTIEGYEASSESLAYDMSQDVDQMRQDLTEVGDTQRQQLEDSGLRQELFDTSLTPLSSVMR